MTPGLTRRSMPGADHDNGREMWCNAYVVDGDQLFFVGP
jgi:hypothetical protein